VRLSTRMALGALIVGVQGLGIVSMAAAQSGSKAASPAQGGQTACSIIDPAELKRLTGLKDVLGRGPVPTDPADLPKGRSECEYLGLTFSLSSLASADEFARARAIEAKGGTKVESVAGVGDDAFYWWDPKPGSYNQVGIAVRAGNRQLTVLDLTSSDSVASTKPRLLAIAKALAPTLR
jgi:hypothetical protein